MSIPLIDDRVHHVGVTHLRRMNAETVKALTEVFVFQVDGENAAVLFPYSLYLEIQQALWPSTLVPSLEEMFDMPAAENEPTLAPGVAEAVARITENEPPPPSIADITIPYEGMPACKHCGKPNEKVLCMECFLAGHRNQCTICGEKTNA